MSRTLCRRLKISHYTVDRTKCETVNMSQLVPLLLAKVQELEARVKALEAAKIEAEK